ncbi:MAG: hypothetical protein ABMA13_07770 [Chthoniobacteraceae bacterium]
MKPLLTLLLAFTSVALAAPQLPVDQAAKIATDYLKENDRSGTWITSITFDAKVWSVKWNAPVNLSDTKRETGLEIAMDGSIARYTEQVSNVNAPGVVGVPADRARLQNHRTRADRPSILGMKH